MKWIMKLSKIFINSFQNFMNSPKSVVTIERLERLLYSIVSTISIFKLFFKDFSSSPSLNLFFKAEYLRIFKSMIGKSLIQIELPKKASKKQIKSTSLEKKSQKNAQFSIFFFSIKKLSFLKLTNSPFAFFQS